MTKNNNFKVEEAIAAIANGQMVVVVDDDDRENEGDLIMAATKATPEQVAFIIRHTSGILCTAITKTDADRLNLVPMVAENDAPLGTAFTVSVDYKHGLTTGISAEERCATIRALGNDNVGSNDFVRPGHVFPLVARRGGVLMRSGHTEAAVDLAKLANLPPVGLLAELVNDDGTVCRGQQVRDFAKKHDLLLISVDDLIAYRQRLESLVERIEELSIITLIGEAKAISYKTPFDDIHHLAVLFGNIDYQGNVLTRLHRENIISDVFGNKTSLKSTFNQFEENGGGVLIYLREGATGVPSQFAVKKSGSEELRQQQWRDIGLGAQILRDLGINQIDLLTSQPRSYVGLPGFGIKINSTKII